MMRCKFRSWVSQPNRTLILAVLLGLGGGFWLTIEAIAPQIARAEAARRVDLSLDRLPNETYESLLRRAEAATAAAVQDSFNQDNEVTGVAVTVVAQNQGAIAPILSLQVTRPQWLSRPDLQSWATYYRSAKALLRFDNVATTSPTPAGTIYTPNNPNRSINGSGQRNNTFTNGRQRVQPITNSPFTPGQPTVQPGIVNSTPPPSLTPAPGQGLTPIPPTAAPVNTPSNPQLPLSPEGSIPSVPSTSTPTNAPLTPLTPVPNGGTTNNTATPTNTPSTPPTPPVPNGGTTNNTAPGT